MTHGGVQRARNAGGAEAKGDILWFWDCDCLIEPDTCKTFVDTFNANPTVDFIYSGYRFLEENGGIPSEPFDPWTLKVANYISTCFPMRREVYPGWDEKLESLQDWDLWLTITEKGGKGLFIPGYAFATAMPKGESISAKGCTPEEWLKRVKAVKDKHNLPDRKTCVTSVSYRHEGIRLAKLIDADYKDYPQGKPHNYSNMVQVGFSLDPRRVRTHAEIFRAPNLKKRVIFWTAENIAEIFNAMSLRALAEYSGKLNEQAVMYVEDLSAKKVMEKAGFMVTINPMPMDNTGEISPLPSVKRLLADVTEDHRQLIECLKHSLPEFKIDYLTDAGKAIADYTGVISLSGENTISFQVKRALLAGRHVISNIQSPFCGYIPEGQDIGAYVTELVDTIRKRTKKDASGAADYWRGAMTADKLMEVLK
jgi:hypothetical protein